MQVQLLNDTVALRLLSISNAALKLQARFKARRHTHHCKIETWLIRKERACLTMPTSCIKAPSNSIPPAIQMGCLQAWYLVFQRFNESVNTYDHKTNWRGREGIHLML